MTIRQYINYGGKSILNMIKGVVLVCFCTLMLLIFVSACRNIVYGEGGLLDVIIIISFINIK